MKYKNQKLKLLYLAKILQEKTDDEHGFTLPQIQEELAKYDIEANRKTLYADIAALNEYGIEIIKNQEGYKTFYHYGKREFEPAELRLIIDAIASSKFITIRKSKQLIKKLEKMVSIHEAKLLNREVIVSDRVKNMNESIFYTVDAIQYAIANNHRIKFRYYSWNMKGEMEFHHEGEFYDVSPWALCWDSENYYMVGYDTNIDEIRHYRVDKMMNTEELLEKRLVSQINKAGDHITLTFTSKGAASLIRGIQSLIEEGKVRRSIPAIDGLIPKKEVMLRLDISHATLYNWKKDGTLIPVKVGKKYYYRAEDVALMEKNEG